MDKGKIITIEGTDFSGKETQSNLLFEKLNSRGIPCEKMSFPNYSSPTGKIIGGPYLGKPEICEGWFPEGAVNVHPKIASLYYLADRLSSLDKINQIIDSGRNLILDRYVASNMAHQGEKFILKKDRFQFYQEIDSLEYGFGGLPRPDKTFFLYVSLEMSNKLRKNREQGKDQHELSESHLKRAEAAYLELAEIYGWEVIGCVQSEKIRTRKDISKELFNKTISLI